MTLRITRDDRIPDGVLKDFPYRDIRDEEERQSAASRWPLLASVDRQLREQAQRQFLRNQSYGPDDMDDPTDTGSMRKLAEGSGSFNAFSGS